MVTYSFNRIKNIIFDQIRSTRYVYNANHIPALKHLTLLSLVGRRHEAELLVSCDNSSFPPTDEDFSKPDKMRKNIKASYHISKLFYINVSIPFIHGCFYMSEI